jgi:ankyrin repeat protein
MALSKALLNQNDEAIEALLSTDECDPNCFVSGGPALFHCMHSLQQKHFRALLNTGKCDLNLANPSNGMTPLMHAAWQGLSAYASALIKTGECRLNDTNALNGMTPLFYAASEGHTGVVRVLLADDRCDVDTPHSGGKTALEMAREGGYDSITELLLTPSIWKREAPPSLYAKYHWIQWRR